MKTFYWVDICRFLQIFEEAVEVSITVCVNAILTCRLGLLCAANSHSIKAAMASSEECPELSPYNNR